MRIYFQASESFQVKEAWAREKKETALERPSGAMQRCHATRLDKRKGRKESFPPTGGGRGQQNENFR